MADLESRLRTLFSERSARRLARGALLATGCATALGALVLSPTFAAGAAGTIIGGIAVNITSNWVERLFKLAPDDEEGRTALLEDGLAARDPAALAVAAATLAAAGPELARALPDEARAAFITTLSEAMAEAGGPLAALAPAYRTALTAPAQADWGAIRASAQQQIQISAQVLAGEGSEVVRSGISIKDTQASIDARVIAEKNARIKDSPIDIQGVRPPLNTSVPMRNIIIGPHVGAGGSATNAPSSYIERAEQVNLALPDHEARRQDADLRGYLALTLKMRSALDLSRIDPSDATYARPMDLARVYIALNTTEMVREKDDTARQPERERPLSAVEAFANAPGGRMILLGAPGGGKSTLVSQLAHCLAGAALAQLQQEPSEPFLAALPGWQAGACIPVPIILRDLAADPAVAQAKRGSVALIIGFLRAQLAELACPNAVEPLLAALRAGRAMLLLDGFDEVVGTVLPRVAEAIADAARAFSGPLLITCRTLDYQEEPARQLAGFTSTTLADLEPEQIDRFIAAWYAELAASGRRPAPQAAAAAREMQGAVQSRAELRDLARTPLLLTLMAQVHAFRGTLPDARARLYEECIDLLLLTWRQPRDGEPGLIEQLELARFGSSDLLALMARLGFEAHTLAARDATTAGPADLSEAVLLDVLADLFAAYDPAPVRSHTRAALVLHALAHGNGLLLQRGPKRYTFAHRTFQEFLAGYYLKGVRNAPIECQTRADQIHWHEALLLMVGYQVLRQGELAQPIALAEKLLTRGPLAQCLAGDILVLVGQERARTFDPALVARGGLWPQAIRSLRELQSKGQAPDVPAALRNRAGLALGRLCYGELKDLALPNALPAQPDPRLPLAVIGIQQMQTDAWRTILDTRYWCSIEAGPFWSGDDRKDGADSNPLQKAAAAVQQIVGQRSGPLRQVQLDQPYRIARYPVTNADYARFLAANGAQGYDPSKPWWTAEGRTFLAPEGNPYNEHITHPRYWSMTRYNGPLLPVVGVSWYEAAAYCRWLTREGYAQGWLPPDQEIRLPTWLEWERAARHTDQRRYPWGTEVPDPERANYRETEIGGPSPVGSFPRGRAICGAEDMAGNMMEWTATPWGKFEQHQPGKNFTNSDTGTISYSWYGSDKLENLCCGARGRFYPYYWFYYLGFRLIQSLRSS